MTSACSAPTRWPIIAWSCTSLRSGSARSGCSASTAGNRQRVLAAVVTVERGAEAVAEEQQVLARGRRTPCRHLVQRHAVGGAQPVVDLAHLPAPGRPAGCSPARSRRAHPSAHEQRPGPPRGSPGRRPSRGQRRSNRSLSMTLTHAATKSRTNFSRGVLAGVDLGEGPQLRVRAEDQVDRGGRSTARRRWRRRGSRRRSPPTREAFHCVPGSSRLAKKSLVSTPGRSVSTPCGDAADVGAEHPQAADEDGHLRGGEVEQVGLVDEEVLRLELLAGPQVVAEPVGAGLEPRGTSRRRSAPGWRRCDRGERHRRPRRRRRGAAFSTATVPASTMRSASDTCAPPRALNSRRMASSTVEHASRAARVVDRPAALRLEADAAHRWRRRACRCGGTTRPRPTRSRRARRRVRPESSDLRP